MELKVAYCHHCHDKVIGATERKFNRNVYDHLMFKHGMFGPEIDLYTDTTSPENSVLFFRGTLDKISFEGVHSK